MTRKTAGYFRTLLALLLSGFFLGALAAPPMEDVPTQGSRYRGMTEDGEDAPKKVMPLVLPAYPQEDDLLFFYVSPIQTQKFAIDPKSLAVGEDEVRYTLVGLSSGGAKNVSYEGVQCSSGMTRRYATGRYDGTWSKSRSDEWKDVQFREANRPQVELMLNYFCDGKSIAGDAERMIFRIRHNRSVQGYKYDNRY